MKIALIDANQIILTMANWSAPKMPACADGQKWVEIPAIPAGAVDPEKSYKLENGQAVEVKATVAEYKEL
jgi:hypothetical protein